MSSSGTTPGAAFRAKAAIMKSWRPENAPSNRDRLELYALHKQAVSGDAPMKNPPDASVADKAKLNAWRNKRGMTQVEAMSRYVSECDRQIRVYGTKTASSGTGTPGGTTRTPTNTPAGSSANGSTPATNRTSAEDNKSDSDEDDDETTIILTPRGLAAVPLLCAAAAESRPAYLARLRATGSPQNGWWAKQEPLCADPQSLGAAPETLVIFLAAKVESFSLSISSSQNDGWLVSPSVLQSFLWPTHNVLLVLWILLIFICTLIGSTFLTTRTILLGSKRTHVRLDQIFNDEVGPCSRVASSLCDNHQAITVRLVGLVLMPLVTLCEASRGVCDGAGLFVGAGAYVGLAVMSWWYWLFVLPWGGFWGVCAAGMVGWCFALIELAGV